MDWTLPETAATREWRIGWLFAFATRHGRLPESLPNALLRHYAIASLDPEERARRLQDRDLGVSDRDLLANPAQLTEEQREQLVEMLTVGAPLATGEHRVTLLAYAPRPVRLAVLGGIGRGVRRG